MSRLPLPEKPSETTLPAETILLIENLDNSPVSSSQIRLWTRRDPLFSRVLRHLNEGWPNSCREEELLPYYSKRTELSVHDGCLLWGGRVIVPQPGREPILRELHGGHPGISRMKTLARMFVWWPGMETDIETVVQQCHECQQQRPSPPPAPLHPWEWPSRPWARLHLDFAGPFLGHMFLVLVDAHSKWLEVIQMSTTTSQATITSLRHIFARFGLPTTLVTDNAKSFTSDEFESFLKKNGIYHITSAPYHPSTNGLAERAVQSFKQGMKKFTEGTIADRLARFLFHYRNTPHTTTGSTPAELLLGRRPRSRLDCIFPDLGSRVAKKQQKQKEAHDSKARGHSFEIGDVVYTRAYGQGQARWLPATVVQKTGPVSFKVQLDDTTIHRRHQDQIRKRLDAPVPENDATTQENGLETMSSSLTRIPEHIFVPDLYPQEPGDSVASPPATPMNTSSPEQEEIVTSPSRRYPVRDRQPPQRLTYESF